MIADILSDDGLTVVNQIVIADDADPAEFGAVERVHPESSIGWSREGDAWSPPAPPAVAPSVVIVSTRQFRRALLAAGLLDQVEAMMADDRTPRAVRIDWEWATEIRSDYAAWPDMIEALGKTRDDMDALFAAAAQIV